MKYIRTNEVYEDHSCCHSCHNSRCPIYHHDYDYYAYSWPLQANLWLRVAPPLQADSTYQVFRQWHWQWHDFSVMIDLQSLSREKQLIQVWTSVSLFKGLQNTLSIAPNTHLTVDGVLDELQSHLKSQQNETPVLQTDSRRVFCCGDMWSSCETCCQRIVCGSTRVECWMRVS